MYGRNETPKQLTQLEKLMGEDIEDKLKQYLFIKICLSLLITLLLFKGWNAFAETISAWLIGLTIWVLLMFILWTANEDWL